METVTLKYRYGSFQATWRPIKMIDGMPRYEKHTFDWNLDNDSRCTVPVEWWEHQKEEPFSRKDNIKYKDAFIEL